MDTVRKNLGRQEKKTWESISPAKNVPTKVQWLRVRQGNSGSAWIGGYVVINSTAVRGGGFNLGEVKPSIRCGFLILALCMVFMRPELAEAAWILNTLALIIGVYSLGDILLSNTAVAFVTRDPAHPLRSVLFTLFAFFQLALCFAVFYGMMSNKFDPKLSLWRALYFSIVTITTVGYGDIKPRPEEWFVQLLIGAEILTGVFFLAVVIAVISTWVTGHPARPTEKTLGEILGSANNS